MTHIFYARPAGRPQLGFAAIAMLGLTSCMGLNITEVSARPVKSMSHDEVEAYCDKWGGQFVEVSDGSYGCIDPVHDDLSFSCTASGTCSGEDRQTEDVRETATPRQGVDADLSPDAGTPRGGLTPKSNPAGLSPK